MANTTIQKQGEIFISQSEYDALRLAGNLQSNTKYHITKTPKTGVDSLEQMNLLNGDKTATYNTTDGMTINGQARFTYDGGTTKDVPMNIEVPIVAGEGIVIDKKASEEKVEVKLDTALTDGKYVPKTTTPWRVYATNSNGEQATLNYASENGYNAVIQRDSNGRAKVSTPVDKGQIANKGYVDDGFVKKITGMSGTRAYIFTPSGDTQMTVTADLYNSSIVSRDKTGRFKVADPEGQNDAVTKAYADNRFRYTHFIDIEFSPMEGIVICKGIITYVSNSPTPLTSYEQLPLDVELPAQGVFASDPSWAPLYKATKRQTSSGSTYLEITTLQFDSSSYITVSGKGTQVGAPLTKFVDTVF